MDKRSGCQNRKKFDLTLYLVAGMEEFSEEQFLGKVEEALKGGVTIVQLREKNMDGGPLLGLASRLKMLTDRYKVPLIIDDRIDVAAACDAAGVHLGQTDLPADAARAILGEDKIIGVTVKTMEQGKEAIRMGADYFGVGAVYPSSTKEQAVHTPIEKIAEICREFSVPCVAIGGLKAANLSILDKVPANGIAVVSAIMHAEDPRAEAAKLKAAVQALREYCPSPSA